MISSIGWAGGKERLSLGGMRCIGMDGIGIEHHIRIRKVSYHVLALRDNEACGMICIA